ncbi:EMI domain-containing protein 1-like [Hoplias malabaricus]|uniref:EMI domain-containing protein 1-like n=1 Tax=Hoplias malabaricus TaxID=27720 RepID=UPI0034624D56
MGPRWSVCGVLFLLFGAASGTWSSGPHRYSSRSSTDTRRNWCPQSVTKTVTCQVQNGTTLQRVYQTCRWPQGCSGGSYRTVVRPSYKVVYRTVTALEWKCCPGYSGTHCEEGSGSSNQVAQEAVRKQATFRKPMLVKAPDHLSSCLNCSHISALTDRLSSLEAKVQLLSVAASQTPSQSKGGGDPDSSALMGAPPARGAPGAQGPTGPQGEKGNDGLPGKDGEYML